MTECADFRDNAEPLALGMLDGIDVADLLAHTTTCADCQAHLDELVHVSENLLLLAPALEPPEGFEMRVIERLFPTAEPSAPRRRNGGLAPLTWALAAALVVAVLVASISFGQARSEHADVAASAVVRSGSMLRRDGTVAGHLQLVRSPVAHALITVDAPRPYAGRVTCRLLLANGTSTVVGSWGYDDVRAGVWATGIDPVLLAAVRMEGVDAGGAVVLTADLR